MSNETKCIGKPKYEIKPVPKSEEIINKQVRITSDVVISSMEQFANAVLLNELKIIANMMSMDVVERYVEERIKTLEK